MSPGARDLVIAAIGEDTHKYETPMFLGDKTQFCTLCKSKYDDSIWQQRVQLVTSNLKLSTQHDKFFEFDKNESGKYVCVCCWRIGHSASRCYGRKKGGGGPGGGKGKGGYRGNGNRGGNRDRNKKLTAIRTEMSALKKLILKTVSYDKDGK